jgi:hypothetical protein
MTFTIQKAVRQQRKLKLALSAPSGAGKTYTALTIAKGLGDKILLVDTENQSSALYADKFNFDVCNLTERSVLEFSKLIAQIRTSDYDVVIFDSLSHFWENILEEKTNVDMKGGNSYTNWGKITPKWNSFLKSIVDLDKHTIGTFRAKTEYILEANDKGKQQPRKVGLAPIFRDGAEYEFDIFGTMTLDHDLIIEKTRFSDLADKVIHSPGEDFAKQVKSYLVAGQAPEAPKDYYYNFGSDMKASKYVDENRDKLKLQQIAYHCYLSKVRLEPQSKFDKFLSNKEACELQADTDLQNHEQHAFDAREEEARIEHEANRMELVENE